MKVNPRKKYFKKKTTKKPKNKKAVVNRSTAVMGMGFPKKLQFTHKYTERVTVTSTSGVMANYLWACNGLFDPNTSGVGHQPMYFDQMKVLYDHYCVIGSKIKLTVMPNFEVTSPIAFGVFINDDGTTTGTNFQTLDEQNTGKIKYLTFNNSDPQVITATWSAKKYFGGSGVLSNNSLQGDSNNNPDELSYFNFFLQNVDMTNTSSAYVVAEIEYITIWKEIKDIDAS